MVVPTLNEKKQYLDRNLKQSFNKFSNLFLRLFLQESLLRLLNNVQLSAIGKLIDARAGLRGDVVSRSQQNNGRNYIEIRSKHKEKEKW